MSPNHRSNQSERGATEPIDLDERGGRRRVAVPWKRGGGIAEARERGRRALTANGRRRDERLGEEARREATIYGGGGRRGARGGEGIPCRDGSVPCERSARQFPGGSDANGLGVR